MMMKLERKVIKATSDFMYLGITIAFDGIINQKIKSIMAQGQTAASKLNTLYYTRRVPELPSIIRLVCTNHSGKHRLIQIRIVGSKYRK